MYKRLFLIGYKYRNCFIFSQELCLSNLKSNESVPHFFRVTTVGSRSLGTSAVKYCENKDGLPPNKDEAEQGKEQAVGEGENVAHCSTAGNVEAQSKDEPRDSEKTAGKGGGKKNLQNLLDLLETMKVDVTTKRKAKTPTEKRSIEGGPKTVSMKSTSVMFKNATAPTPVQSDSISLKLVAAVSAAASTRPNPAQAKSDLLQQLRQHEALSAAQRKGDVSLGDIIADMKVEKTPEGRQKAGQIRFAPGSRGHTQGRGIAKELDGFHARARLLSAKRLNIFSLDPMEDKPSTDMASAPTLWDMELANQVAASINQMPRNGFEEMIQWTKEDKLWQYPINNEAGLEEEASVPFHEHIFIEKQLADGFPQQGPVRHFMELVAVGLSKNPYLSVQQKKEHIAWFQEYFQQKEDIIKEAYLN